MNYKMPNLNRPSQNQSNNNLKQIKETQNFSKDIPDEKQKFNKAKVSTQKEEIAPLNSKKQTNQYIPDKKLNKNTESQQKKQLKQSIPNDSQKFHQANQQKIKIIQSINKDKIMSEHITQNLKNGLGNEHSQNKSDNFSHQVVDQNLNGFNIAIKTLLIERDQKKAIKIQQKDNKEDYSQILLKYKKLGGNQIETNRNKEEQIYKKLKKSQVIIQQKTFTKPKYNNKSQNNIEIKKNKLDKQQKGLNKQTQTPVKNSYHLQILDNKEVKKSINESRIRLLAEKQHTLEDIKNNFNNQNTKNMNMNQIKNKVQALTKTKKSTSLTLLPPNQGQQIKKDTNNLRSIFSQSKMKQRSLAGKQQYMKMQNSRKEKQKQLNSVAFMLTNLKQSISQKDKKQAIGGFLNQKNYRTEQIQKSFYSEISPTNANLSKNTLIQSTNSPITSHKQLSDKNLAKQQTFAIAQQKLERGQKTIEQQLKSKKIMKNKQGEQVFSLQQKLQKIRKKNNRLGQIKQDIQDQNNQKQDIINEHRKINKNLQISMLQKKDRIAQLQAQINQIQAIDQNQQIGMLAIKQNNNNNKNSNEYLTQLQKQKIQKEKVFVKQKNILKQEISKIEQKILQQQKKYSKLKQTQFSIKDKQLKDKQMQLQFNNKQMSIDLQNKTRQLEQIIKIEQQKSKFLKLQLEQQEKKNQVISKQLKKQQELQQLLLLKLQKIAKQRQITVKKKNQEKQKQKLRLIQQIKMLQQAQNKILLEYQRDSQAATSIFQAIRLKNIELQQQIKQKLKQKQKNMNAFNQKQSQDILTPPTISV